MTERITLRAKSDGTEISGELVRFVADNPSGMDCWVIRLARNVSVHYAYVDQWERVFGLPTVPGTVFKATLCEEPNVRIVVVGHDSNDDSEFYFAPCESSFYTADDIDPSTVVIELEGEQ